MKNVRIALVTAALHVAKDILSMDESSIIVENFPRPEISGAWLQIWFKPAQPHVGSLGSGGMDIVVGSLKCNFHIPLDSGCDFGLNATEAFRNYFVAGKKVIFGGQEVTITDCGVNLNRIVDTWFRADVDIGFRANLQRGTV